MPLATTTAFALSNISSPPAATLTHWKLSDNYSPGSTSLEKPGNYDQIPQLLAHFEENLNFTWYKNSSPDIP